MSSYPNIEEIGSITDSSKIQRNTKFTSSNSSLPSKARISNLLSSIKHFFKQVQIYIQKYQTFENSQVRFDVPLDEEKLQIFLAKLKSFLSSS